MITSLGFILAISHPIIELHPFFSLGQPGGILKADAPDEEIRASQAATPLLFGERKMTVLHRTGEMLPGWPSSRPFKHPFQLFLREFEKHRTAVGTLGGEIDLVELA